MRALSLFTSLSAKKARKSRACFTDCCRSKQDPHCSFESCSIGKEKRVIHHSSKHDGWRIYQEIAYKNGASFYMNLYLKLWNSLPKDILQDKTDRIATCGASWWNNSYYLFSESTVVFTDPLVAQLSPAQNTMTRMPWLSSSPLLSFPPSRSRSSPRLSIYRTEGLSDTYPFAICWQFAPFKTHTHF